MPAIPALIMSGGALGSAFMGSRAAKSASKMTGQRSPEELSLMTSQRKSGDQLRQQGSQLFQTGMPAVRQTMDYYSTLAGGSRAARTAAVAPEAEDIGAAYSGADKSVRRSGLRGGERDMALAENARSRAGQISRLVTGVRPQAYGALAGMGNDAIQAGMGGQRAGAGIYEGLIGNETGNRMMANRTGMETGGNTSAMLGKLLADLLKNYGNRSTTGRSSGMAAAFPG